MAVIDLTVFALAGNETAFLDADRRMQTAFVYQQDGCGGPTTSLMRRKPKGIGALVTG
jgi:hypothetical protein